jgi:uncharacterized damage-inducible protein DinB
VYDPVPEPWLRGALTGVHPLVMPVFFSFMQVREDLRKYLEGITDTQLWAKPNGAPSLGFHLKHLAGSIDRLSTYLAGESLTREQLADLKQESEATAALPELLSRIEGAIAKAEKRLRNIQPEKVYELRPVGRRALPSTVIGLIVHLAEHTQRHLGQAITTARIVRGF